MIKLIYLCGLCSKDTYKSLVDISNRVGWQQQKFCRLVSEGLSDNGVDVTVLSRPPINAKTHDKKFVFLKNEIFGGIEYQYIRTVLIPGFKHIVAFIDTLVKIIKYFKDTNDSFSVVLADPMIVFPYIAAFFATRIANRKFYALVTDVPAVYSGNVGRSTPLSMRLSQFFLERADAFVLLTEKMNDVVNRKSKPYIVIDGVVDTDINIIENIKKYDKRTVMYTGGIVKHYGLGQLVNIFMDERFQLYDLVIYGGGPYGSELEEICSKSNYNNIKYMGILDNDDIVIEQRKASVLINPRFTKFDYTQYSFPSKNMEYMLSGTPTLTTRLPGITNGYLEHSFVIEDESVEGMSERILEILSMSDEALEKKGWEARKWVLKYKNKDVQMKKIVDFIIGK